MVSTFFKDPSVPAQACMIWMHGLGADASDMMGVAGQPPLSQLPIRHVFLNAPQRSVTINGGMSMPAWYDIVGVSLTDREDDIGIQDSKSIINKQIDLEIENGFQRQQIFLAGFSQGAAMALYTGTHHELLGGIVSLSGYLPLAAKCCFSLAKNTPLFWGFGRYDPIVLPEWTQYSAELFKHRGYTAMAMHHYPMEHSICQEEIIDLSHWMKSLLEK